ncbi:hypothetical protein ScPMuIL_010692 [Solemya velum]
METPIKRKHNSSDEDTFPVSSTPYKRIRMGVSSFTKPDDSIRSASERKQKVHRTPNVMQGKGQLKLSAYMNFGLFTVHVVRAKYLSSKSKSLCDSFVKINLVPEETKCNRFKTSIVYDNNNPEFDDKFSLEDFDKRLLISTWHKDQTSGQNEFMGCMSFALRHLIKQELHGWFYLLTEELGQKKHLQVSGGRPRSLALGTPSIPIINKDIRGNQRMTITVKRGKHGFGFSVVESCPVKVGRVDGVSPAQMAGIKTDDVIVRVNGLNVSRSTAVSVAKLMKRSPDMLILDIERADSLGSAYQTTYSTDDTDSFTSKNQAFLMETTQIASKIPLPLLCNGQATILSARSRKRVAIQKLVDSELDFVDFMHEGMQRFSRPLRHCILSSEQHLELFQNIEKLVTISEYLVRQMKGNMPSFDNSDSDDEDDFQSDEAHFTSSIGMIYESKVQMLSQAYVMYSDGLSRSLQLLSDLRKSKDFSKFIKNSPSSCKVPSISGFLSKPIQHIQTVLQGIREIYSNTESVAADFNGLLKVVQVLDDCVVHLTSDNDTAVSEKPTLSKSEYFRSSIKSIMSRRSSISSGSSSSSSDNGSTSSRKSSRTGISFPFLRMA